MVNLTENRYDISVYSGQLADNTTLMAFYMVTYNGYTIAGGGPYDTETEAQREAEIAMRDHATIRLARLP